MRKVRPPPSDPVGETAYYRALVAELLAFGVQKAKHMLQEMRAVPPPSRSRQIELMEEYERLARGIRRSIAFDQRLSRTQAALEASGERVYRTQRSDPVEPKPSRPTAKPSTASANHTILLENYRPQGKYPFDA